MPLSKTAVAIEKGVWPLNVDWWYLTGDGGHVLLTIDFGVPLTGIESVIPGWDGMPLIPLTGTNCVRQSVSDNKLLAATTTMLLF